MAWVEFWNVVLPPLGAVLSMMLTALAAAMVTTLRAIADKLIESLDRQALHSAVTTGVRAELELEPLATTKTIAAAAGRYVLDKGAPEAVKAFDLTGSDLTRLVASKVIQERSVAPKKP